MAMALGLCFPACIVLAQLYGLFFPKSLADNSCLGLNLGFNLESYHGLQVVAVSADRWLNLGLVADLTWELLCGLVVTLWPRLPSGLQAGVSMRVVPGLGSCLCTLVFFLWTCCVCAGVQFHGAVVFAACMVLYLPLVSTADAVAGVDGLCSY